MSDAPDQWTRMSSEGETVTITVRVNGRHVDLAFAGDDLDLLKKQVAVALANRRARRRAALANRLGQHPDPDRRSR